MCILLSRPHIILICYDGRPPPPCQFLPHRSTVPPLSQRKQTGPAFYTLPRVPNQSLLAPRIFRTGGTVPSHCTTRSPSPVLPGFPLQLQPPRLPTPDFFHSESLSTPISTTSAFHNPDFLPQLSTPAPTTTSPLTSTMDLQTPSPTPAAPAPKTQQQTPDQSSSPTSSAIHIHIPRPKNDCACALRRAVGITQCKAGRDSRSWDTGRGLGLGMREDNEEDATGCWYCCVCLVCSTMIAVDCLSGERKVGWGGYESDC